jgi:hypothetical protein
MNPYAPPEATVHDLPAKPGSAFKAIALGLATDIGGTLVATVILALIYGVGARRLRRQARGHRRDHAGFGDRLVVLLCPSLVGLGFSVLGGYVCARIVRRSELKLGAILAAMSALLGILFAGEDGSSSARFSASRFPASARCSSARGSDSGEEPPRQVGRFVPPNLRVVRASNDLSPCAAYYLSPFSPVSSLRQPALSVRS